MASESCLKGAPELYPNPPPSKDVFPPRLWPKIACIQQAAHTCPTYSLIFKILPQITGFEQYLQFIY